MRPRQSKFANSSDSLDIKWYQYSFCSFLGFDLSNLKKQEPVSADFEEVVAVVLAFCRSI